MNNKEYAEEVAGRIIEQLRQGTAPWQKPWRPGELRLPYNAATGKDYRGMNTIWLQMAGYADPRWMTYKQAEAAGAQVRRGSSGTHIIYWKFHDERLMKDAQGRPVLDDEGRPRKIRVELDRPRTFLAVVFNAEQIDGLPPLQAKPLGPEPERHARAEAILANSGARIAHVEGDRAFYRPSTDSITLPTRQQFGSADAYYATALHELGHWTGHGSRLDRDLLHPFGSEGYAREELRAEIASLMLGERLEIGHDPGQHAAYVASWIKALEHDPREIFRAAADAEKISSYVMAFELEQARAQTRETTAAFEQQAAPPVDEQQLRDEANRGELYAIQRADPDLTMRESDREIGETFARLLREIAEQGGEQGRSAGAALERFGDAYPNIGGAQHWQAIGYDIRTGTGTASPSENLPPIVNAVALRALSGGARPELTGSPSFRIQPTPQPVAQRVEIGERVRFTPNEERAAMGGMTIEGVVIDAATTTTGNLRYRVRTDEIAPQDGQPQEWLIYSHQGTIERLPGRDVSAAPTPEQRLPVLQEPPEASSMTPQRTYLIVPYRQKDEAKQAARQAGFRLQWDKEAKQWFAPEGIDVKQTALARWLPENTKVQVERAPSPEESFADAIRAAGLELDGLPVMDGKIHRVAVAGDKGAERSGSYAGHMEGRLPGGFIQNHKTGTRINWKYEGKVDAISPEERERLNREAVERAQRRAAEVAAQHDAMAKVAQAVWNEAAPATADHPYCAAKGITHPGENGLRVVPAAVSDEAKAAGVRIAKNPREAKAMREAEPEARVFIAGDLLVPARDAEGKLWSVQSVNPQFKGFMKDGRKAGLYTVAGADPSSFAAVLENDPTTPLVLAEGYATADTVARLRGHPVVAAFDSGNLDAVARSLRERWPDRPLLIAADNDHRAEKELRPDGKPGVNVGLKKAQEAAANHKGAVLVPSFGERDKGSDWNDYAQQHGDEAARKELERQVAQAKTEAAMNAERMMMLAREREAEVRDDPTTSADDALVARERAAAHDLMGRAIAGGTEARAEATDALVANATGAPRPVAAVAATMDRTNAGQGDEIKEQRQAVLDGHNNSTESERATAAKPRPVRPRARGQGAEL